MATGYYRACGMPLKTGTLVTGVVCLFFGFWTLWNFIFELTRGPRMFTDVVMEEDYERVLEQIYPAHLASHAINILWIVMCVVAYYYVNKDLRIRDYDDDDEGERGTGSGGSNAGATSGGATGNGGDSGSGNDNDQESGSAGESERNSMKKKDSWWSVSWRWPPNYRTICILTTLVLLLAYAMRITVVLLLGIQLERVPVVAFISRNVVGLVIWICVDGYWLFCLWAYYIHGPEQWSTDQGYHHSRSASGASGSGSNSGSASNRQGGNNADRESYPSNREKEQIANHVYRPDPTLPPVKRYSVTPAVIPIPLPTPLVARTASPLSAGTTLRNSPTSSSPTSASPISLTVQPPNPLSNRPSSSSPLHLHPPPSVLSPTTSPAASTLSRVSTGSVQSVSSSLQPIPPTPTTNGIRTESSVSVTLSIPTAGDTERSSLQSPKALQSPSSVSSTTAPPELAPPSSPSSPSIDSTQPPPSPDSGDSNTSGSAVEKAEEMVHEGTQ
ncbi:hypothetical protein HK102_013751 [Quaeritorhiza haematococci]|nr:hypothetical protein HK102_013751 [Quaeritorhiza haematococci]